MSSKKNKKTTLKEISIDLRSFDFDNFDVRKDKKILLDYIQQINAKLGRLLRNFK